MGKVLESIEGSFAQYGNYTKSFLGNKLLISEAQCLNSESVSTLLNENSGEFHVYGKKVIFTTY